jgi:RNA polymerase sigma-70 factor (ECF subfamily)
MTVEEYNSSVDLYADNIYRFILKNLRDEDKAKDIVQDSYERLWVKLDTVSGDKVKSYLFTSAYHLMIDMIRKDTRQKTLPKEDLPESGYDSQYNDINEVLHEALGRLSEIQRSVILLRDYEGYSYDEIGQITGLSESQVKVYIFRARAYLKNYIGSLETIL